MLKTLRMQKFRLIFPLKLHDNIVTRLHEAGVVQLKEISDPRVTKEITGQEIAEISALLSEFRGMGEFLKKPKDGPAVVKELPFGKNIKIARTALKKIEPKVKKLKEEKEELRQSRQKLLDQIETLKRFQEIKFPLEYLSTNEWVNVTVGCIGEDKTDELFSSAKEALGQKVFAVTIGTEKKRTIVLVCRTTDYQKLAAVLYRYEVEILDLPKAVGSPAAAIAGLKKKLLEIEKKQKILETKIEKLAKEKSLEVFQIAEILEIQKERLENTSLFGHTDATIIADGWIPEKKARYLEKVVYEETKGRQIFELQNPTKEEVESIPVELNNPKMVKDFEFVTGMYGLAKYDEIDPTPFLSFTFPLFFAIAIADVGYGLALGIFMASGVWLSKIFSKRLRRMMMVCAVFTVITGIFMGGFFGLGGGIWVNPVQRPIPLLKLVIFIGIIHLLVASGFAGAVKDIFRRDWKSLVFSRVPAVLIILGFSGLVFSIMGIGLYEFGINFEFPQLELFQVFNPMASAGIMITVLRALFYGGLVLGIVGTIVTAKDMKGRIGGPLNFVYSNVIGYIGDVSSYTRLMALAIAGSVISFSINLILGMLYSGIVPQEITLVSAIYVIPFLIVLAFAFLAAHSFNIFINSIGAFVHTMRLHFAEFFGKFYESGGEKFTTFKVKRRFTKVKEGD